MGNDLKPWQLVVLTLVFPAVGAFFVCTRKDARTWQKAAAIAYFIVVFLVLLTLRRPTGELVINAVPLN